MIESNTNNPVSEELTATNKTVLLLGFGDVNQRLARLLISDSTELIAVRRSALPNNAKNLEGKIEFQQADITDTDQLKPILKARPDQIVITIAPSNYSEQGYRDSYLKAVNTVLYLCQQLALSPEIVFVSSSSVYAQNNGEVVNEDSVCDPFRYNGQVLLEAETRLSESPLTTTIVRFAGIYGSGRHRLISMCLNQNEGSQKNEIHWTNRINAEDCARVIEHILSLPTSTREPLYLASDNLPVERHRVYNWIRAQFKMPLFDVPVLNPEELLTTGKRCENSRLVQSGFKFTYPSYKDGFTPVIAEFKAETQTG